MTPRERNTSRRDQDAPGASSFAREKAMGATSFAPEDAGAPALASSVGAPSLAPSGADAASPIPGEGWGTDPPRGNRNDDFLAEHSAPPSGGGSVMFWVLVTMAAAVFAPCVLLPVWREYQALQYSEQVERAALEQARAELQRQQRLLAALQNDPATIARVARRELRYKGPDDIEVPVGAPFVEPAEAAPVALTPVKPPAAIAWIVDKLPDADYDRLFCADPTRTILMCLAGGLVLSAFVVFSPRRTVHVQSSEF